METYMLYKQFAKPKDVNHPKQEAVDFWMELMVQACKPTVSTARCPVRPLLFSVLNITTLKAPIYIHCEIVWHKKELEVRDQQYTVCEHSDATQINV